MSNPLSKKAPAHLQKRKQQTTETDLQVVQKMPLDEHERLDLRESRRVNLNQMFEDTLSQRDSDLWRRWQNQKPNVRLDDTASELRIFRKLDDFILRTARTLGWQLFLSDAIVSRIEQWWHKELNGPQLLERLGKELALGARVSRGQASLPMDDQAWHATKNTAKRELRPLLNKLRNTFGPSKSLPSTAQVLSFIRGEVEREPQAFPFLSQSLQSLLRFLQYLQDSNAAMRDRLVSGGVRPAEFFDAWGAWATNRTEESFRQRISELGRQKRAL